MNEISKEAIKEKDILFNNMQTLMLSTLDKEMSPNCSYAPSAIDPENGNFYIYISQLSKHTSNLLENNQLSAMIIEDESNSKFLFGRKRFTFDALASVVDRESDKWNNKINILEDKFGESIKFLKPLKDFILFEISPKDEGLLVYGFGRAFKFTGRKLNKIKFLNEVGHNKGK